ncbi:hypothetical protein PTKIN_Ptkin13bG0270200 [Pterospermum kingtungense]
MIQTHPCAGKCQSIYHLQYLSRIKRQPFPESSLLTRKIRHAFRERQIKPSITLYFQSPNSEHTHQKRSSCRQRLPKKKKKKAKIFAIFEGKKVSFFFFCGGGGGGEMKLSSKPISSPGRAGKYPPPLMLFLRGNVGSRSRGRSRSSPMFVRRKNIAVETQEPSSPKVTCMGQVRVKRSTQTGSKPGRPRTPTRRRSRCKWIRNFLFFHHFPGKLKAKAFFRPWKKWGLFFQMGFCKKPKTRKDSSKFGNKKVEDSVEESDEDAKEAKIFVSSCSSPPRNALILTRCRSAPYRSSSLAYRFWGSPLANQETTEQETELENRGAIWKHKASNSHKM